MVFITFRGGSPTPWPLHKTMTGNAELRTLIEKTVAAAIVKEVSLEKLRGIAFFDPARDELITPLASFSEATGAVASIPDFPARFGANHISRIIL